MDLLQAKRHLRVDHDDDDEDIDDLIVEARQFVEGQTWRSLITQTWTLNLAAFPRRHGFVVPIQLEHGPVQSVESISYYDAAGVSQVLDAFQADLTLDKPELWPPPSSGWPCAQRRLDAVTITFIAGYGLAGDVPQDIVRAMKLIIGHWYDNRAETVLDRGDFRLMPMRAQDVIDFYTIPKLG